MMVFLCWLVANFCPPVYFREDEGHRFISLDSAQLAKLSVSIKIACDIGKWTSVQERPFGKQAFFDPICSHAPVSLCVVNA